MTDTKLSKEIADAQEAAEKAQAALEAKLAAQAERDAAEHEKAVQARRKRWEAALDKLDSGEELVAQERKAWTAFYTIAEDDQTFLGALAKALAFREARRMVHDQARNIAAELGQRPRVGEIDVARHVSVESAIREAVSRGVSAWTQQLYDEARKELGL